MIRKTIQIGNCVFGTDNSSFIIAEVGSNHNQDFDTALRLIDAAADAGVDAVKFQTFRAADHYSKKAPDFKYLEGQNTYDLIESLEIDRDWHGPLQEYSKKRGVEFFSSPCDNDAIDELTELDVPAYKVASFDLPDTSLIKRMARAGKPVILSTGMATMEDVGRAVEACKSVGNDQVVLLQCTSLYPAPTNLSNLHAMATMASEFDCLVGYSDHTIGDHISIAAIAMGACMIEKHFTLDREMDGPDHPFAINPAELKVMVSRIRDVEAGLGDGIKAGPREEEKEMFEKGRRSLHSRTSISAGQVVTEDMLIAKRPGYGLPPFEVEKLIGRVAKVNIEADQWISWDMFNI